MEGHSGASCATDYYTLLAFGETYILYTLLVDFRLLLIITPSSFPCWTSPSALPNFLYLYFFFFSSFYFISVCGEFYLPQFGPGWQFAHIILDNLWSLSDIIPRLIFVPSGKKLRLWLLDMTLHHFFFIIIIKRSGGSSEPCGTLLETRFRMFFHSVQLVVVCW